MVEEWLKQFNEMVQDLSSYSFAEVIKYEVRAPVSQTILQAIEKKLGAPLALPIRNFYQETNGLTLHWRIKPNLSLDDTKKIRKKSDDYYVLIAEYIGDPFAMINLIPIEDAILKQKVHESLEVDAKNNIEFQGVTFKPKDFVKRLKPFDQFSPEYCMAFLIEEGNGNPKVMLLNEGCMNWDNSKLTDFGSYLGMLLATRGIVEAREKIFYQEMPSQKESLIGEPEFWKKNYTAKMFLEEK